MSDRIWSERGDRKFGEGVRERGRNIFVARRVTEKTAGRERERRKERERGRKIWEVKKQLL